MADKTINENGAEVSIGRGLSLTMDSSSSEVEGKEPLDGSTEADLTDLDEAKEEGDDKDTSDESTEEDGSEEDGDDKDTSEDDESTEGKPEDLGEFKPEEASKWEDAYFKEGVMNVQKLSQEFWANATKDSRGSLNEGTYSFLATKGLAREDVKAIESALVEKADASKQRLFTNAGGAEVVQKALEWATKGGGYTAAQKAQFNKAIESGDESTMQDALDLLTSRHQKATPTAKKRTETRGMAGASKSGNSADGIQPYKSEEDVRKGLKEVNAIKDPGRRKAAWDKHMLRHHAFEKTKK